MAGWNLKLGEIQNIKLSEDQIWSEFNFVFSESCKKRNTYKFGFIKSLLDNCFNGEIHEDVVYFSYNELFARFAENYWNLVVKYNLRQMRPDGRSFYSKVETIFKAEVSKNPAIASLEFSSLEDGLKNCLIEKVTSECKKNVVGALYSDFDGNIYSFNLSKEGLYLNRYIYEFLRKYKNQLEKMNYYSWAKFLEQINDSSVLTGVIDKLDLSTPKRSSLSIYREILHDEFEENNCFYCGRKLNKIHIDHFIPWDFIKDDKLWNFVVSCPRCNLKKNCKVPDYGYVNMIIERNKTVKNGCLLLGENHKRVVLADFKNYSNELIPQIWKYAKLSGIKEFKREDIIVNECRRQDN